MTNIESKFSKVGYFMHICCDIPSENTGLWQLPIVASAFKLYGLVLYSNQPEMHKNLNENTFFCYTKVNECERL